jgi:DNA-binding PadR family transcriptional regulator
VTSNIRRSPLALAILGLLEDGPLHPYGMQQLIKRWGKDEVINVGQRATLYKMINRLCEAGLIKPAGTTRDHSYPERTSYELTEVGRETRQQWMSEVLSTPRNEFPEFPAGLSFLPPRATMLETEYLHAVMEAEIRWLDSVIAGLSDGSITWSARELQQASARLEQ